MSFISLIRDWLLDPIGLLFLLSLFLLLLLLRKRPRWAVMFWGIVWIGAVCMVSSPRLINPLLVSVESQFVEEPECLQARPIVLLGGGVDSRANRVDETHYMDKATFVRTMKARELAQRYGDVPVLVAGGALRQITEAAVIAYFLRDTGVMAERVFEEGLSSNTHENAVNIRALIDQREFDEHINLVTSALHMKRAKAVFEHQGLQVCPVAVDRHGLIGVPNYAMWPQISSMQKFDLFLHERLAWFVYKMTGKL